MNHHVNRRHSLRTLVSAGALGSTWVASGASAVGGCCGIFPPHIDHLRATFDASWAPATKNAAGP